MVEFIVLGVQDRVEKPKVGKDSVDKKPSDSLVKEEVIVKKKGLYLFHSVEGPKKDDYRDDKEDYKESSDLKDKKERPKKNFKVFDRCTLIEDVVDNVFKKELPDLKGLLFSDKEEMRTPRIIKRVGDNLYFISRAHITEISVSEGIKFDKKEFSLEDFCDVVSAEESFKRMGNHDILDSYIHVADNGKVYFSLYVADKMKRDKSMIDVFPGILPGYLFCYDTNSQTKKVELVKDVMPPTGKVTMEGNILKVVSKNNLLTYTVDGDNISLTSTINTKGNILDFSSIDNYTVCSTNEEGYVFDFNGKSISSIKSEGFSVMKDNEKLYLPSQASSVLIYKTLASLGNEAKYYALFGLDRGKIRVYEIDPTSKLPKLEYKKTIPFLSIHNNDADKDKNIWNLRQVSDFVCFTMGNMFVKIGIDQLLNFEDKNRITRVQETDSDVYLSNFKNCYSIEKLLRVPHKISSYDFWSVSK